MLDILLQVSVVVISLACVVLCSWRRKHGYTTIPDEENVSDKLTRDKEFQRLALKEALCQFFLNLSGKYTLVEQLDDIGCRLGRSWFIVKESKSDKKLLVLTKKSSECRLSLTPTTIQLLNDLFEPLSKHPHIFPVTDIGVLAQKPFVFVVESFQKKGTLKDVIYKKKPKEEWCGKYRVQGKGLNLLEIKTYGRQILQAMLFLHDKGIPTYGHVHSGNIFIKKGVCRILGYEQAILGFKSRLYPRLSKLLKKNKYAIDTLCFGHLLYEMSYGQELFDAKPGKLHFEFCSRSPEVGEILKYVFGTEDSSYPDIQDIFYHRFFQGGEGHYQIDPDSIYFKPQVTRSILKPFKKNFKKGKSRKGLGEVGIEAEESPEMRKRSPSDMKQNVDLHSSLVIYNAETDTVSAPSFNYEPPISSPNISSSQPDTSPNQSPRPSRKQKTDPEDRGKEPSRPLFGVEALMDSIKQAIELRHNTMNDSDESSRAASFSSGSPPPSPGLPAKYATEKPPPSSQKPPLSQKPSVSFQKPSLSSPKPPRSPKPPLSHKPSLPKKLIQNTPSPKSDVPTPPPPIPKGTPPLAPPKPKSSNGVQFRPQKAGTGRSALLKSITEGSKLRPTVTNDRSIPRV